VEGNKSYVRMAVNYAGAFAFAILFIKVGALTKVQFSVIPAVAIYAK